MTSMLLWLMACAFDEERFLVDGVDRWCEHSAACSGTFEPEACVDVLRSQDRTGCTYDEDAGKRCYDELETAECFDDPLLDLAVLVVPESCERAYACEGDE